MPILEISKPSSEYHDRVSGFDAYSLVTQKRGEFLEQADGILLKRSVERQQELILLITKMKTQISLMMTHVTARKIVPLATALVER